MNQQLAAHYDAFRQAVGQLSAATNSESQHQLYEQAVVPGVLKLNAALEKVLSPKPKPEPNPEAEPATVGT